MEEATIVYPDEDLAKSRRHGVVFRVPRLEMADEEEVGYEVSRRRILRPQSAKGPSLEVPSRVLPMKPQGIRPWSAQPKLGRSEPDSGRKISRQTLRKPHFRPPQRSPTASISSETSSLITAVGLANKVSKLPTDTPDSQRSEVKLSQLDRSPSPDKWAVCFTEPVFERPEPEPKPEPKKRTLKKHPSFETWVAGSPHDSDEYDTDIDIDDFVSNIDEELKRARRKQRCLKKRRSHTMKDTKKDKPIDPTGRLMYHDQCEVQGLVPVSFIQRHLGDKNLTMRHHYLGGNGTKPIAVALWNNTITETLDIGDNFVEGEGARYIAAMLKNNTFITNLNISCNFIGKEGLIALSSMLETNTTLKVMSISGNQLTDSCGQCLIEGLKNNSSLTSLDMSSNHFGEIGGIGIGGAISVNDGLLDIDLSWNSLRNKGATAVIASLAKNATLEVLDVSWNGLGLAGAEALKQALKVNKTLKVLDLTNNRLNTKAAESLAWGLSRNVGLETLVLNLNPIKDAGVEVILRATEKQPHLKLLSIEEIGISRTNYEKIKTLESQKDITILHGGVGGYQRVTTATSMLRLFSKFIKHHHSDLTTSCMQYDRDRTGMLGMEELKMALKEGGLRLTNKQLNTVVEEINFTNSPALDYRDLLSGKTLEAYFHKRPSRAFAMKSTQIGINRLPDRIHRQLTVA